MLDGVSTTEASRARVCTRCVMDTSDPEITFDADGVCNHCRDYEDLVAWRLPEPSEARRELERLVDRIKRDGRKRDYDCIIGVSGGVDSSYLAHLTKELGLRPLAVHLDNGWDSELAVQNIQNLVSKLGIDLYTHVVDWDEFRDIQRSFFLAGVVDIEMISDHAINAILYRMARKE
jgi:asparagine synthetase B (glutamine-hydrolysing)